MSNVTLHIYDLSQGMARSLSPAFLGKQIDGIWHTGIDVFDREYYFGGGICSDPPKHTPYGIPFSVHSMGTTRKTREEFFVFLRSISRKNIPQYILDLPAEAMNSPMGPMLRPIIDQMQGAVRDQSTGRQEVLDFPQNQPSSSPLDVPQNQPSSSVQTTTANVQNPNVGEYSQPSSTVAKKYWKAAKSLSRANRTAIQAKLHEFIPTFPSYGEPSLTALISASQTIALEKAFPLLDYIRLYALESSHCDFIAKNISALFHRFVISGEVPDSAQMMCLRVGVNLFMHKSSTAILCEAENVNLFLDAICEALENKKSQIRKTAALLGLNLSGAAKRYEDVLELGEDDTVRLLYAASKRINDEPVPSADEAAPLMQMLVVLTDGKESHKLVLSAFDPDLNGYCRKELYSDDETRAAANELSKILAS